jgi:hypothetical protein
VDIDIGQRRIVEDHYQPFFEHGEKESFFANGVSLGDCYEINQTRFILFMGWQVPENGHWRGDIGRLRITPDLTLVLDPSVPLLGSHTVDPISLSYPCVWRDEHDAYRMWYGSTLTWDVGNGEMVHVINHASSDDGQRWCRHGLAVPYAIGVAQAFSKPTVLKRSQGGFSMWFSYRKGNGEKYRIGYASSDDGYQWMLDLENPGIAPSATGWDSEMVEYPYVFRHGTEVYMLYNGNGFGKTGFGLARLVADDGLLYV